MSAPNLPAPDEKSFEALDGFLQALHAGRQPDRSRFLAEHPELGSFVDCLEALDELAPPPVERPLFYFDHDRTIDENTDQATRGGALTPGADFGKYELLDEIGRGGMGVIYKARQKDLERIVAIKMILSSQLASRQQLERFLAEARAMARLQHPHIVRIHEIGELHGQPYLVMEYITGVSLAEHMRRQTVAPEEAARIVGLIARAVEHLHQQGIVHRDLKPSNILLDDQGMPYVTDFGLVKMVGSSSNVTTTGAIVGTPAYMAPEQATGKPEQVGPCSDVYSLGAILYELLTGRPPFQEENPLDTLVQVIEGEPTQPRLLKPDLPPQLETICMQCLEKTAEERYRTAAALADDLDRFRQGEDVEARQAGLPQQLRRWARREPALVYRLGGLVVLMVVVQINYQMTQVVSWQLHLEVLGLLAAWVAASIACQRWLNRERRTDLARLAWAGADVCCLTAILALTGSQLSPLVVGYPFIVAASGLWFQLRLVWFTTAACIAGYVIAQSAGPHFLLTYMPHYHIIFVVTLAIMGFVVGYQVQRIRVLNRYYENRPLP
ncbi:MAG: serine/threonine protein kinase [Planctomycetia bacterium]|nr:serine/threonine protein kinase [Planctomycetia bacterium]